MTNTQVAQTSQKGSDVLETKEQALSKSGGQARRRVMVPDYRVFLRDDAHELKAYMPGVASEDLSLELEGRFLKVRAKAKELSWEGFTKTHTEFMTGHYEADFKVPEGIDREKVSGVLKNGVLTIKLPKADEVLPKSIQVNVAQD